MADVWRSRIAMCSQMSFEAYHRTLIVCLNVPKVDQMILDILRQAKQVTSQIVQIRVSRVF